MNIVFCINRLGLEGLGATVTSLIRNCSDTSMIKLCFFCSNITLLDKKNIKLLLTKESFRGKTEFIDLNIEKQFGHLASLHGDWTAYGRLLIPEIIKDEFALYLDADLVIELDILSLPMTKGKNIISAVHEGPVQQALDNQLFIEKLNWEPLTPYFNSGVLLFNNEQWRETKASTKIKEIAEAYPAHLISHDQTLLNALCLGNFNQLPKEFNTSWPPDKKTSSNYNQRIIHFIGSPKPWDISGKLIHNNYTIWAQYNTSFWNNNYGKITTEKLVRTWRIRNSIFKNIKHKLFN
ncbi:glycosyltransferase family 8 protein [Hymenobacter norwichensis]|uniref:glycosyltransferase family 8 protein n=1 Tax=Hymenobacter norwichensis TaxID=223903 RepID=UPI00047DDE57|nr:glycosyltransferase [Hymenobacter norwichensis]